MPFLAVDFALGFSVPDCFRELYGFGFRFGGFSCGIHSVTGISLSFEGKMVRLAGLEPASFHSQDFRSRVFRCLSLPIDLRQFSYECKRYFASTGSFRQNSLCKTCASLLTVQSLCKMRSRAGICARGVQNPCPAFNRAVAGHYARLPRLVAGLGAERGNPAQEALLPD
jgi:hypothetical protein